MRRNWTFHWCSSMRCWTMYSELTESSNRTRYVGHPYHFIYMHSVVIIYWPTLRTVTMYNAHSCLFTCTLLCTCIHVSSYWCLWWSHLLSPTERIMKMLYSYLMHSSTGRDTGYCCCNENVIEYPSFHSLRVTCCWLVSVELVRPPFQDLLPGSMDLVSSRLRYMDL